jgi:hypothetical protein
MTRRFLLCCLVSWCGLSAALAEPPPTIPVSIYCFRYAPQLDTIHLRTGPATYQKVELSTANIVGPHQSVLDNGAITLHRQETAADGAVTWPLVGRVRLPDACPRALILLLPAPAGEPLPYRGLAFVHTNTSFPLGSMKFVNLSTFAVRGAIGDNTVVIPSGKVKTLQPSGEPGASLPVLFEYRRDERWQRMAATRWALRDDRRLLMCIYEDPVTHRMNLRSIPDRTQPEP